jgi:ABC-type dipeptide/oligopeptide/nickel transport system permease subunit
MPSAVPAGGAAPAETPADYDFAVEARGRWALARRRFLRHRLATVSLVVLTFVFAAGFLAEQFAPYAYHEINADALSSAPSWAHPFGTDQVGRDYFSRVLYGIGTEAQIALLVAFFGTLIGTLVGAFCGYFGGSVDNVLMRLTDLWLTLPPLITVLVGAVYLDATSLFWISVLLACLLWMPVARIVRGTCLSLREMEYVDAARAMGASDTRIIRRHILPNAIGSIAVAASAMTATAIILETTLSYLGYGVTRFAVADSGARLSLGDVMSAAKDEGLFNWWGIVFPGLAIVVIVMPIYFIGDGLRDAFDPTGRGLARKQQSRLGNLLPHRVRAALHWPSLGRLPRPGINPAAFAPLRPVVGLATSARLTAGDYIARRSRRRAARRHGSSWLLVEAVGILVVIAGAAVAIYAWKVNPTESRWRATATHVQNVSRAQGAQTEISMALDPTNTSVLFGASNDSLLRSIRIYTSLDAGRSWSSDEGPELPGDGCARGDPSVGVTAHGRQYVAFTVNGYCTREDPYPYLVVASRAGAGKDWTVRRIASPAFKDGFDDKPALAVGPGGHVHVVWSRLVTWTRQTTVISSSADGGLTWSPPSVVHARLRDPQLVSITVSPLGTIFVGGVDSRLGIWVAASENGGRRFTLRRAAPLPYNQASTCISSAGHPFPSQAIRCLGPNPSVTATANRVYVTYASAIVNPARDVRVAVLDRFLRPVWRGQVGPPDAESDQFWPTSAVDAQTGKLWACFYDTSGDPSRQRAWFSCTTSRDGRHWSTPMRAARASADAEVLWEDARIYNYGDVIGYGGHTSLAAHDGVAYPMWIDTDEIGGQEIFAARLSSKELER